jgi:hypothetical protein
MMDDGSLRHSVSRVSESTSVPNTDEYESVTCPACKRLHFVNKITGKLLGER